MRLMLKSARGSAGFTTSPLDFFEANCGGHWRESERCGTSGVVITAKGGYEFAGACCLGASGEDVALDLYMDL